MSQIKVCKNVAGTFLDAIAPFCLARWPPRVWRYAPELDAHVAKNIKKCGHVMLSSFATNRLRV